jgi:molybdopterin-guanine dinucleotide biosynthesis protein A
MGRDKATLSIAGTTLIERTLAELRREFDDIVVVAAPESIHAATLPALDATLIRDEVAFAGPAPALLLGLRAARHDLIFACSCDLPMLNARLAAYLCSLPEDQNDAVIPMIDDRLQVLHAVYRKRCAATLEAMLAGGGRSLREFAALLDVRSVGEQEIDRIDPELRSFFNINTPSDYAAAVRWIESRPV